MGLDVYLRKCSDRPAAEAAETACEQECSALWERFFPNSGYGIADDATKDEYQKERAKVCAKHGVADYWHSSVEKIETPDPRYPEHTFSIGYFRSSYNSSGFNNVMRNMGLGGIYELMGITEERRDGVEDGAHDWRACKQRIEAAIEQYKARVAETGGLRVMRLAPSFNDSRIEVKSEQEAMDWYLNQVRGKTGEQREGGWSCLWGDVFPSGLQVHGFVTRKYEAPQSVIDQLINGPTVYVLYKPDNGEDGDYYLQALEIMSATMDRVLNDEHPEHFYMVWSG